MLLIWMLLSAAPSLPNMPQRTVESVCLALLACMHRMQVLLLMCMTVLQVKMMVSTEVKRALFWQQPPGFLLEEDEVKDIIWRALARWAEQHDTSGDARLFYQVQDPQQQQCCSACSECTGAPVLLCEQLLIGL